MKIHVSYKYVVWIILLLIISPNVRSQIDKNQNKINVLDFGAIPNGQPIIIGASERVKAYNNLGGQPIGEKLAPPVLPNLN